MSKRRTIIYAVLALAIAFVGQHFWYTLFNPLIWDLTYIGTRLARLIHQPDYDSVASARAFDLLAIGINALLYFALLVAGERSRARLRKRRVQKSAVVSKN